MSDKHPPTPPARREAALRYQAQQLLRDAAAWGYRVEIHTVGGMDGPRTSILVTLDPPEPPRLPPPSGDCVGPGLCPHDASAPDPLPEPCRRCGGRDPLPF